MSPDFGSFGGGGADVWGVGQWVSQVCDLSDHNDNGNTIWNVLTWDEVGTSDESKAYVRVTILDSSDNVLQDSLVGTVTIGNTKSINVNNYANAKSVDIKIKFRLYSLNNKGKPVVKNIHLT